MCSSLLSLMICVHLYAITNNATANLNIPWDGYYLARINRYSTLVSKVLIFPDRPTYLLTCNKIIHFSDSLTGLVAFKGVQYTLTCTQMRTCFFRAVFPEVK